MKYLIFRAPNFLSVSSDSFFITFLVAPVSGVLRLKAYWLFSQKPVDRAPLQIFICTSSWRHFPRVLTVDALSKVSSKFSRLIIKFAVTQGGLIQPSTKVSLVRLRMALAST